MATTTHVSEHQYSLIRDMIKSGKSLSDIHDWNNGMSDRIHKRTLKKLYNTIARAEENELTAALARAEAAEAEAQALRGLAVAIQGRLDFELERRQAAEARVAELEAAQGWRPVTEKPDKPGWYVVYDSDGHVFYNADIFPYRVARWTGKWDSAFNGLVDYWRPLPPAPAPQEPTP